MVNGNNRCSRRFTNTIEGSKSTHSRLIEIWYKAQIVRCSIGRIYRYMLNIHFSLCKTLCTSSNTGFPPIAIAEKHTKQWHNWKNKTKHGEKSCSKFSVMWYNVCAFHTANNYACYGTAARVVNRWWTSYRFTRYLLMAKIIFPFVFTI